MYSKNCDIYFLWALKEDGELWVFLKFQKSLLTLYNKKALQVWLAVYLNKIIRNEGVSVRNEGVSVTLCIKCLKVNFGSCCTYLFGKNHGINTL